MNKKLLTLILFAAMPLVACGNDSATNGQGGQGQGGLDTVVTFDTSMFFEDQEDLNGTDIEVNGVKLAFSKASGQSSPKYFGVPGTEEQYASARLYANNTLTVSSNTTFKNIKISCRLYSNKDGLFTASTGTITANDDRSVETWTGSTTSLVLTVSELQRRVYEVEVTLGAGGQGGQGQGGQGQGGGTTYTMQSVAQKLVTIYSAYTPECEQDSDDYGDFYNVYFFPSGSYSDSESSMLSLMNTMTAKLTSEFKLDESATWDDDWGIAVAYYTVENIIVEMQTYYSDGAVVDIYVY